MKTAIAATILLTASVANAAEGIAVAYDGAVFDDLTGGVRRGSTYLGALRLQFRFERRGLTAFVEGLNIHGGQPSEFAGDAQGVSNMAAPRVSRVEEAWIQQNFFDERASVLVGRYDLSTEFDRTQSAGLFLNSAFGTGPELSQNGPSIYPSTSLGARVSYRPVRGVLLRAAAFNGFSIVEADYLHRPAAKDEPRHHRLRLGRLAALPPYDAKLGIGAWRFSDGRSGVYVVGDQRITRGVAAFGQFGFDRARGDRFARSAEVGLAMSAPLRGRSNDELGLALASARSRSGGAERTLECTYLAPITSRVAIQPDVQYVIHPNTRRATKNALVALMQFEISF